MSAISVPRVQSYSNLRGNATNSKYTISKTDTLGAALTEKYTLTTTSTLSSGSSSGSSSIRSQPIKKVELKLTPHEISMLRAAWSNSITDPSITKKEEEQGQITRPASTMFASSYFWRVVYETLLERHPHLEDVLPSIKHQTVSFAGIMYTAIMNLEDLSQMDNFLGNLGRRHGRVFGVESSYFEAMGIALMDTFADKYGHNLTSEVSSLWARLYCFLANSLIQASDYDPLMTEDMLIFPTLEKETVKEPVLRNKSEERLKLPTPSLSEESFEKVDHSISRSKTSIDKKRGQGMGKGGSGETRSAKKGFSDRLRDRFSNFG